VAEDVSGFLWGHPITNATHTTVLQLTEPISNVFTRVTDVVYVDVLVDPVPRANPPSGLPADVQTALYMGESGKLNVFHAYYAGAPAQRWSELDHAAAPTGEWIRVTLKLDYTTDVFGPSTDKYFQVSINGGDPLSAPHAYQEIPLVDPNATNGTWFLQANSGNGGGNTYLTSLSTEGPGALDDVVVTTNTPAGGGAGTIYGVPIAWYQSNGYWDPDGDADGDGSPNWAEWVAGTDSENPDSHLMFTEASGEGTVSWSGTTNTGSSATYSVHRTEDLVGNTWTAVATGIPKGTTTWSDPAPPAGGTAGYKVNIPWVYTD